MSESARTARQHAALERSLLDAQRRCADLSETFVSTIEALSTALELRTTETEGHAQRVSLYTVTAARSMGVGGRELEQMHWGALLHDVGKIGIREDVLKEADKEMLEDLILAAVNEAHEKASTLAKERIAAITGGIKIPGLF